VNFAPLKALVNNFSIVFDDGKRLFIVLALLLPFFVKIRLSAFVKDSISICCGNPTAAGDSRVRGKDEREQESVIPAKAGIQENGTVEDLLRFIEKRRKKLISHERLASVGLYPAFYLSICLKT